MTKKRIKPYQSAIILPILVEGPEGLESLTAALDTGATYCVMSEHVISRLGYDLKEPLAVERMIGVTTFEMPLYSIKRLEAMGLGYDNCLIGAFDLPDSAPVDALLGLSFMRHFRFTLDMPGGFFALRYSPYYNGKMKVGIS